MLVHISVPATKVLDQIARKRVGRTLEALELAGCSEALKAAIKKQIWDFKNEIQSKILEREEKDGMDENTDGHTSEQIL